MSESYPIYKKSICHFYKVYSDYKCIEIYIGSGEEYRIQNVFRGLCDKLGDLESNESEFIDAFDKARNELEKLSL